MKNKQYVKEEKDRMYKVDFITKVLAITSAVIGTVALAVQLALQFR